jgi:uncharacterized delta-60 repeat protein/uncharacterized repeat protein (TIGR01451 family)
MLVLKNSTMKKLLLSLNHVNPLIRKILVQTFFITLLSFANTYAQNYVSIDKSFNIGTGLIPSSNEYILTTAIQPDGKILAGGQFTSFNGISKNGLVRLNADGSIDNSFNIGTGVYNSASPQNFAVQSMVAFSNGKILVGGYFDSFNGTPKNGLVCLNPDGSIDNTFNIGFGPNNPVESIIIQPDGKILVGGDFTTFNGVPKNHLIRLNSDGSIDNTFNIGTGANSSVYSIILQPDGKILVAGYFTAFNSVSQNRLVRLNADGSVDNTFNIGTGANNPIENNSMALQQDGKIVVIGFFTSYNGIPANYLARINSDGSFDSSFNIGSGFDNFPESITIQPDGKIIVGGFYFSFNGSPKSNLIRLNSDGSVDNTFNIGTGPDVDVLSIAIQTDGKILLGGDFENFNGISAPGLVRLAGSFIYNTIRGNIFSDSNHDCKVQPAEKHLPSVLVKAAPGPYYGSSDANGNYNLKVDSGSVAYTISQEQNSINSILLINQCASSYGVSLTGAFKDTCCFNFADSVKQCSLLDISVQKTRARRCFKNTTYVNYSNYGNSPASGAVLKVEYPTYFIPLSSSPAWASKQGTVLTYNIGTIAAGASGQIIIIDSVACIAGITGLTECIKASISPLSNCVPINSSWDKSSMTITGSCQSGKAHFVILNAGTGDMSAPLQYRVYENDTLIYSSTYQLKSGESLPVDYPANGQTIRLEADQPAFHPGNSRPRATIEGCGGNGVTGFVTTVPQDDYDEETTVGCKTIVDSNDPNEKEALPSGIGSAHNIAQGEEIEYVIHFQNTGTDTAYTVTVIDTLDANLDAASFTKGASSFPYTLDISGKGHAVLKFTFDNIKLPDSTKNSLASSGLVSFRIKVPAGATTGTIIRNKAYIFFDFNDPVITNETMHTVDNSVATDYSKGSNVQEGSVITVIASKSATETVKIYPNPSQGLITVEMPVISNNAQLRIFTMIGALQKTIPLNSVSVQQVSLEGLQQGMYLYEVRKDGERKAGGMLEVK